MARLLAIGLGGALGAMSRYAIATLMNEITGRPSVLGTLIANLSGALVLGLLLGFIEERAELPEFWRWFGAVGFLGAYTTFSTFMFESADRLENGEVFFVFAYIAGSIFVGLMLAYGGMVAGRSLA
jgi:CrcB protein